MVLSGAVENTPGFIHQMESDPRIGELQLRRFARFSGDYAAGKNPKGALLQNGPGGRRMREEFLLNTGSTSRRADG